MLIVDRSLESREVLRTVLELRGATILEASEAIEGLRLARRHRPDVIVLDLDEGTEEGDTVCAEYDAHSHRQKSLLLVLGAPRSPAADLPSDQVVPKPYHYGPLIRKIESLLDQSSRIPAEPLSGVPLRHSRKRPGEKV